MPGDVIVAASEDGRSVKGYLAVPEAGNGPGVVLLVEGDANDPGIRQLGDLYAAEGYVALCTIADGSNEDVAAAIAGLRSRSECTGKVAAIGFGPGRCRRAAGCRRQARRMRDLLFPAGHRTGARTDAAHRLPGGAAPRRKRPGRAARRGRETQTRCRRSAGSEPLCLSGGRTWVRAQARRAYREGGGRSRAFAARSRCCAGSWARITISKRCGRPIRATNSKPVMSTRQWRRWSATPMSTTSRS